MRNAWSQARLLDVSGLEVLLHRLRDRGHRVLGPTVRDGAIVHDEIHGLADLPRGLTDEQAAGRYRLRPRKDDAYFGFAVGPTSWKSFLHAPRLRLWRAQRSDRGFDIHAEKREASKLAFFGVRPCELGAMKVLDHALAGDYVDPEYARKRGEAFVVVVQCGNPGGTCFCASMDTGPRAESGFDVALTELLREGQHDFLLEIGSDRGEAMCVDLPAREASTADVAAARAVTEHAAVRMGRSLDTRDVKDVLDRNLDSPVWAEIGSRCLSCTNCTMVCPTCFCTTVEDHTSLAGDEAERWRRWDSCFTMDFSYIHGGSVRKSAASRYRQWMTHKLASWHDQFGTSGCVGCGRCITWCPVGIDLTEGVRSIREAEAAVPSTGEVIHVG